MVLTRSDRARLTTHIIRQMALEEWPIIDTTLLQFGLPIKDLWEGSDKAHYVAQMLRDINDDTLLEFGAYLRADLPADNFAAPAVVEQDAATGAADNFVVFISHLSEHQRYAGLLQDALSKYGVQAFVAHKDIEPTAEWQNEIETALRRCDALVALLHPNFHASHWTDQEIGFVMGRSKPAFAVKFGEAPYGFIGRFQAFNSHGPTGKEKEPSEIAYEIMRGLVRYDPRSRTLCRLSVNLLAGSRSFFLSDKYLQLAEMAGYWDADMIGKLAKALKENDQIYGEGWTRVPERVQALLQKWSNSKPNS